MTGTTYTDTFGMKRCLRTSREPKAQIYEMAIVVTPFGGIVTVRYNQVFPITPTQGVRK